MHSFQFSELVTVAKPVAMVEAVAEMTFGIMALTKMLGCLELSYYFELDYFELGYFELDCLGSSWLE